MLRSVLTAFLFASCACAAIWPPQLGTYQRNFTSAGEESTDYHALWKEFGLEAIENAGYASFHVTAWRFQDSTGAYAGSLELPPSLMSFRVGNYLVSCQGKCPKDLPELAEAALPHVSHASIPTLGDYLPARNRVPRSERYILGPVGLRTNAPQIPASAAAFDFGAEAALARYGSGQNQVTLAIFSYPTPAMARQQTPKFQTNPGVSVKRTGSLVAVALGPADLAQKLLSQINYSASVQINETPPLQLRPESAGQMLVAIINLAGLVLGFCLISGLLVAGFLFAARRFGYSGAEGTLTTLHLHGK